MVRNSSDQALLRICAQAPHVQRSGTTCWFFQTQTLVQSRFWHVPWTATILIVCFLIASLTVNISLTEEMITLTFLQCALWFLALMNPTAFNALNCNCNTGLQADYCQWFKYCWFDLLIDMTSIDFLFFVIFISCITSMQLLFALEVCVPYNFFPGWIRVDNIQCEVLARNLEWAETDVSCMF